VFEKKVETKTSAGDMPSAAKTLARKGNVQGPRSSNKGDIEEGFRKADAVVEGTYTTQVQTHTALETHGLNVASATMSRPSLDEVYLLHAGRTFGEADAREEAA